MAWTQSELVESVAYYEDRPVYFVEDFFGVSPDEWQGRALEALASCRKGRGSKSGVAVRSGHGVGKTTGEAWAALWFLCTRAHPKVPCTAPTRPQLKDMLWAEMALWMSKAKDRGNPLPLKMTDDRVYMIGHRETWFATARTGTTPEAVAGFHQADLLFIVDEASGMRDQIMAVVEGALTTDNAICLMCGNPTKATGYFMDAFGKNRKRWHLFTVSGEDSPRVSRQFIAEKIEQWGYDSNFVRVRIRGLPPRQDADQFILPDWVERAHKADIKPSGMRLTMGVDVARYGDSETVITPMWGMWVPEQYVYDGKGINETAGLTLKHARELMDLARVPAISIRVDDSGVGGGVTDLLQEAARDDKRLTIVPCNFGGPGNDEYYNETGIMWGALRELMRFDDLQGLAVAAGGVSTEEIAAAARAAIETLGRPPKETEIRIPNDDELIGQLMNRKFKMTSNGKIRLESKEEMRARNVPSPDRADSLALAVYQPPGEMDQAMRELFKGASLIG